MPKLTEGLEQSHSESTQVSDAGSSIYAGLEDPEYGWIGESRVLCSACCEASTMDSVWNQSKLRLHQTEGYSLLEPSGCSQPESQDRSTLSPVPPIE